MGGTSPVGLSKTGSKATGERSLATEISEKLVF